MRLRPGVSIWELLGGKPPPCPPLRDDQQCDVVIVGAGISGGIIALHLARAGLDVIVLDRRDPLAGSTLACTSLLQYELDHSVLSLERSIGRANAHRAYRACYAALQQFPAFVASLSDDCDLRRRPSLYVAGQAMNGDALREEAAIRRSLDIDAAYLDERELAHRFGIRRP